MKIFEKIHRKTGKAIAISMLMALWSVMAVSCIDEIISLEEQDGTGGVELKGDVLGFYMELDKSMTTRAGLTIENKAIEGKDDWIDMQDKFRIFFFSETGDFLFGVTDRIVGSVANRPNSTEKDYWYIRIPMTMIVDRNNQEYDIAAIKAYLKANKFKIAILANWPNTGDKVNPGDYDDSSENNFKTNPSSSLKGEPLWGWVNSVLNPAAVTAKTVKNVNDLHFLYADSYYSDKSGATSSTESTSDRPSRYSVYSKIYPDVADTLRVGEPTDWVKMRDISEGWKYEKASPFGSFDSKETANQWIRYNWDPSIDVNNDKQIYRHYQHMWYLWNFNALYKVGIADDNKQSAAPTYYSKNFGWDDGGTINGSSTINQWGYQWWLRNGKKLFDEWINKNNTDKVTSNNSKEVGDYTLSSIGDGSSSAFLEFVAATGPDKCQFVKIGDNYGVKLPTIVSPGSQNNNTSKYIVNEGKSSGYIKFLARTSGTLRIKWGSADDNEAQIVVQKGGSQDKVYTVSEGNNGKWFDINGTDNSSTASSYRDISVGEDSQSLFIFCNKGHAVIYGIEYIRGKYLFDSDREGVIPNDDQGIPMYGVQQFDPIPDWEYGTTYNLPVNVSLVRSLAKVVVNIPTAFGQPSHVYMRCMNRTAFCEPMDVETNTSELWNKEHHDDGDIRYCEWFNIYHYGCSFNKTGAFSDSDVRDSEYKGTGQREKYVNWLGWFHGNWGSWWNNYVENKNEYAPTDLKEVYSVNGEKNIGKYPHLFNPHINRSDFCSFIYAGVSGEYHRYILYMPDKNIDDPNYPGIFFCTPKVPHIEYRFKAPKASTAAATPAAGVYENTEFNLDDNDCYRIYFTNYGFDSNFSDTDPNENIRDKALGSYDDYEKNRNNLKYHWPIMRNHVYEFFVSGSGPETPNVKVKVTDWSHEKVVIDW